MECREFEKSIPAFLKNSLDFVSMEEFQAHMNSCPSCKEELSIQFLVTEGMKHLESGDNFDLDYEFNTRVEASRRYNKRKGIMIEGFQWLVTFVLFLAGAAFMIIFG